MLSPADELLEFLKTNGVGIWVRDSMFRTVDVEEWVGDFLARAQDACSAADHEDAERLRELIRALDATQQKAMTTKKIRELIT